MISSQRVQRFFRTPKGLMLIVLVALAAIAAPFEGVKLVWAGLLSSVALAGAIDLLILRYRRGEWEFPSGAVLTGMFVAMVLSSIVPWYQAASASAVAIVSKYILRTRSANVFNPAALALVLAFYIFHTGQNWWGALGGITPYAIVLLFAGGAFIVDRVNKFPLVLVFLAAYYALFSLTSFVSPGHVTEVAEIFRAPDLQAVLFFAFFILTDPPTSPVKYRDQIIFGVLVAAASFAFFELAGSACFLLAGVLVGNVWEARRRYAGARSPATSLARSY